MQILDSSQFLFAAAEPGYAVLFQGSNFIRLLAGLWVSVRIALVAMAFSVVLGLPLGVIMTGRNIVVRVVTRIYLDFIRVMPPLVLLFVVFFDSATLFGLNLSGEIAAVIVFTLWGTAEMGDLTRGALQAVATHQYQSAMAIGMNKMQVARYVVVPQAVRSLVPNVVNLSTRMIKTTSLVVLIGVIEVLKVGQSIIDANRFDYPDAALWVYGTVFALYFIVCFPISWFSRRLEKKWKLV